jgi:hypothetical protein
MPRGIGVWDFGLVKADVWCMQVLTLIGPPASLCPRKDHRFRDR